MKYGRKDRQGYKEKGPKQNQTSAKDLSIEHSEGHESLYHRLDELTNKQNKPNLNQPSLLYGTWDSKAYRCTLTINEARLYCYSLALYHTPVDAATNNTMYITMGL